MRNLSNKLAERLRRSIRRSTPATAHPPVVTEPPAQPPTPASFCMHAWNHLRLEANGDGRVCSAYELGNISDGDVSMSVDRHTLSEIWNSDMMRGLRRDMVAGRPIPGCRICQADEAGGGLSKRLTANAKWENGWLNESGATIKDMIDVAISADFRLPTLPTMLEIEVGNLCNFKCRTCNAGLSSLIGKDPIHRAWAADQFGAPRSGQDVPPETHAFRRFDSLARLGRELSNDARGQIRRIYFLGGEPLLVRGIGTLLEELVNSGKSQDIWLLFVSNASVIPGWLLSLGPHFRHIDFAVSIDGHGDLHDYIRYPGRWPDLMANLKALQEPSNAHVMATTTVSMLNVLSLCRLFRYLDSIDVGFAAYPLHWPRYLAVGALPSSIRRIAAARLREYGDSDCRPIHRALVQSLAALLESGEHAGEPTLLHDFMLFTNDLDASRTQSIHQAEPELVELLGRSGFPWIGETLLASDR
jgi:hypothetical protein